MLEVDSSTHRIGMANTLCWLVGIPLLLTLGCDQGDSQSTTGPSRGQLNAHVKAGLPGACLLNWRLDTTCGSQCTGQTQPDLKNCQAFLDCYENNNCGPTTCGEPDQACGVNVVTPKMGAAPKTIADSVYACMGCSTSALTPGAPPAQIKKCELRL